MFENGVEYITTTQSAIGIFAGASTKLLGPAPAGKEWMSYVFSAILCLFFIYSFFKLLKLLIKGR